MAAIGTPALGQTLPLAAPQVVDVPSATPHATVPTPLPDMTPTPLASSTPIVPPTPGPSGPVIKLKPRLTQFYQGLAAGDGDLGFEYGAKVDLSMNADLAKLGLWKGLSMTVHPEYNFGSTVNKRGGRCTGQYGARAFQGRMTSISRVCISVKRFPSASLLVGKINMIDLSASSPFRGGAGIDSFWNITFAAPPSGTVPAVPFRCAADLAHEGSNIRFLGL